MRKLWLVMVFCALTAEFPGMWEGHWSTPWHFVTDAVFGSVPVVHLYWFDAVVIFLLLKTGKGKPPPLKSLGTAVVVSIAALLIWAAYGALRGGSVMDMRLQLRAMIITMLAALMQAKLFRTREHFVSLGKTVIYAALFRFVTMVLFYILVMRDLNAKIDTVTSHGDSVLFVSAIAISLANAIQKRSRKTTWKTLIFVSMMLWCIQVNNRRLAYVSLVGALIIILSLIWTSDMRRKLLRVLRVVLPIVLIYVAVGWAHPTGIFKPIAKLQSTSDPNDLSTQSRIVENIGLIVTLQTNPLLGTGFGHEYIEVSSLFSVGFAQVFKQYRYMPHNSLLGLVAFMGALGFSAFWMVFPITVYVAARIHALTRVPLDRTIAMVIMCNIIIYANQVWGDLGNHAIQSLVIVSMSIAAAARAAVFSGTWSSGNASASGESLSNS